MFQILESSCSTDLSKCCSDYAIAKYISIVKSAISVVHIVVPIILIIMLAVQFTMLTLNPDDNGGKLKKSLINKIVAAVIVFMLPFVLNLVMSLVSTTFELFKTPFDFGNCWNEADDINTSMNETKYEETVDESLLESNSNELTDDGVVIKSDSSTSNKKKSSKKKSKSSKTATTVKQKRKNVVSYAKKFLGNPYSYGGCSMTKGTDCSCFVQNIYAHYGYTLKRSSRAQAADSSYKTVSESDLKKGDLIFYGNGSGINHVAMYIGNRKIIHASNPKDGIKITSNYRYRTPIKIKRIIT